MTKEKLEKEAKNWLRKYLLCCNCEKKCNCIDSNSYCEEQVLKAYVDSAEPREKRIEELEVQNNWLEGCKLELGEHLGKANDRIAELEQQIEKMKCCYNCKHSRTEYEHCKTPKNEKWEIKEND